MQFTCIQAVLAQKVKAASVLKAQGRVTFETNSAQRPSSSQWY